MPLRLAAAVAAAACLALAPPAGAIVSDVQPIDGPSADVLGRRRRGDVGGRQRRRRLPEARSDGRSHVFAAQFRDGGWRAPQRVDVGQASTPSWPRIGAGDGGRLVVTWVQEFGVESDRMFSATLDPGATRLPGARSRSTSTSARRPRPSPTWR